MKKVKKNKWYNVLDHLPPVGVCFLTRKKNDSYRGVHRLTYRGDSMSLDTSLVYDQ